MPIDHARAIAHAMGCTAAADAQPNIEPPEFSSPGSPGRMAALLVLGTTPEGVRSDDLRKVIRQADVRVWDESRMKAILTALRAAGLAVPERDESGTLFWFSPGARRVAALRGTWPPKGWTPRGPARRTSRHADTTTEARA